jgi:transketolase
MSQVETFGHTLLELGENKDIIVLDLDVSDSTKTSYFEESYPDRFIELGISEQDGVGVAAGLAMSGKIPLICGFAFFLAGRAWEQIVNSVASQALNVKIVATHSGLSPYADGGSHQMLSDLALMRVIPNMTVEVPADAPSTKVLLNQSVSHFGPVYLRLVRGSSPVLYSDEPDLQIGKINTVREGSDITIAGAGVPLTFAVEAAKLLKERQIEANILDLHTIKPIDEAALIKSVHKTGAIVTVEEHNIIGGVGGAVAEVLGENYPVPLKRVGVNDLFGESSRNLQSLYEKHNLTPEAIEKAVIDVMEKKIK